MLADHPNWNVKLRRVRRLLSKVVSASDTSAKDLADEAVATRPDAPLIEEEVADDWCLIIKPAVSAPTGNLPKPAVLTQRGQRRR